MIKLPSGWTEVKFEDVVELNPPKFTEIGLDEDVTFVPMAAISEVSGTIVSGISRPLREVNKGFTHFKENDVLFAKITPSMENGKSAIASGLANQTGVGSTEFHVFRSHGAVLPAYLWRFVRQKAFRENAQQVMTGAVGQQRVPISYLKSHALPLPPLAEQERITAKLSELMARTARARLNLQKLPELIKQYKKGILEAAFQNVEGETATILDLSEFVTSGSRGWARYYSDAGPLFLRVGNTARSSIKLDLSDRQFVKPPPGVEGARTQVKSGDVLVTITADLGRIAVVPPGLGDAYVNQHIALVRLKEPDLTSYIAWFLVSPQGQLRLHANTRGTTRAGLGLKDIKSLSITLPDSQKRSEIVRRVENAFSWLDRALESQNVAARQLERLDDTLLSKAFKGELTHQDARDEPADVLLDRIRVERLELMKRGKPPQKTKMKKEVSKDPKMSILDDSANWPAVGLPFSEIAKRNPMPYEVIRDAIFAILAEKDPKLLQVFNVEQKVMYLTRAKP